VTEVPADEHGGRAQSLYQRAADAYLSATKQGKSALLVSPTWAEIDAVTEKVREALKTDGAISKHDEAVTVFDSLSWTEAQKRNASQYEPGQRLRFVRKTRKFDRGETVEVAAVVENGLRVRRPDGTEVDFIPANAASTFDVGEARELKVATGDWLLLQANHGREFINGERVQVREIQNGRISLTDGRQLPANFNTFTHGYAVTSHSSQSKTVDEVLLVASSRSFAAVNREQFYVSISRGRERVHVFTDDVELLARRVTDSHERKAAVELEALRDELAKLGFVRKEPLEEKDTAPAARAARQHRPARFTRLSPVQRLAQVVEEITRWLGERFGLEPKETTVEKVEPATAVKQTGKIEQAESLKPAETVKPAPTVREARLQREATRRKPGRSITPPGDAGHSHSHSIGV
jgi:hypothetical protein